MNLILANAWVNCSCLRLKSLLVPLFIFIQIEVEIYLKFKINFKESSFLRSFFLICVLEEN